MQFLATPRPSSVPLLFPQLLLLPHVSDVTVSFHLDLGLQDSEGAPSF